MTGAELAARRTAAAALVADFRAEAARHPLTRPPDGSWALRLALAVDQLLEVTDDQAADVELLRAAVLAGNYDLSDDDVRTVLDALDVAADHKRDLAANCPDCDGDPAGTADLCGTCEHRLAVADEYDALAERIEATR
jgi:hypothetical protein